MRKFLLLILVATMTVLVIGSGVYIAYSQNNPPTSSPPPESIPPPPAPPTPPPESIPPPPAPRTPTPPESIPPEERAVEYYFVNEEEILGRGMQLPRTLTAQENDAVIQIGLNIEPVSKKISQGYNTELGWMSYNKNYGWGYGNQMPKVTEAKPETTYFPAVRIGLGIPQQEEIDVAVDLNTQTAVYAIRRPDKRVSAPSYVRYLTEEEKVEITAIALETEAVQTYIRGEYEVDYRFVAAAISKSGGYLLSLEYDIVSKGIPAGRYKDIEDNSMKIYPSVFFKSDSWTVEIIVDLETEKVVYTYMHPIRQGS